MKHDASEASAPVILTGAQVILLAVASAVVTANAYYIHPIIARVAEGFGVSDAMIGMVPAFNQLALSAGIFLLLPLGDRFSNRHLTIIFVVAQSLCLVLMAVASSFWLFTTGSTLLGFFTIAPYLLSAYASKRVEPGRLGRVTAILTTGIIIGILVARTGGGVIAEHFGWRTVYYLAAALMIAITLALPMIMRGEPLRPKPRGRESYVGLVLSILPIIRSFPQILISGAIQALSFGVFLATWMGLGLHLTSPEMGYGVDIVGYLAGFSIFSIFATPRLGSWADKVGARRARFILALCNLAGVSMLLVVGHSIWLLAIPIIIMNLAGPAIDVTGRMTFLSRPPEIRTRLMTVYIVMMFAGGGAASWAGTAAYAFAGWMGTAALTVALSALVALLAGLNARSARLGAPK